MAQACNTPASLGPNSKEHSNIQSPVSSTAGSAKSAILSAEGDGVRNVETLLSRYSVGDVIGSGAFSEVRKVRRKSSGKEFAVKIIDKAKCRGKESMIQSEVSILKRAKHPNIIRLFEMYESDTKIFLIMELVSGGELFDRIVERGHYTESDAAKLVYEVLLGVDYLHTRGICHRDLKPENLLFNNTDANSRIMISDFGLSKIYEDTSVMRTACGTPGYVAPEVLRREGYTNQVDMWSIGVITYILLSGYPPFYEENNHALFQQIMQGRFEFDSPYWDSISAEAKEFVSRLLVVDTKARMNTKVALVHPFITSHVEEARKGRFNGSAYLSTQLSNLAPTTLTNLRKFSRRRSSEKNMALRSGSGLAKNGIVMDGSPYSQCSDVFSESDTSPALQNLGSKTTIQGSEGTVLEDSGTVYSFNRVRIRDQIRQYKAAETCGTLRQCISAEGQRSYSGNIRTARLLSYSIHLRMPGLRAAFAEHKNSRLNDFTKFVMANYDIICLQEIYSTGSTRVSKLINAARQARLEYSVSSSAKGFLSGTTDDGLIILSAFPILQSARLTFQRSLGSSRFTSKGVLYARIQIGTKQRTNETAAPLLHLFNTCLQRPVPGSGSCAADGAEAQVRLLQITQLRTFIREHTRDRRPNEPILIVGDFGINSRPVLPGSPHSEEYSNMMGLLTGMDIQRLAARNMAILDYIENNDGFEYVPYVDILHHKYGVHPVTYADLDRLTNRPAETCLTDKSELGSCKSLDYAFWAADETKTDIHVDIEETRIEQFAVSGQAYSHLSDHYGVSVTLKAFEV